MIQSLREAGGRAGVVVREHGIRGLFWKLFVDRTHNVFVQFVRYGIVGLIAAAVDTGALLLLAHGAHVEYLVAGTVGFVLGTTVNYLISVRWVFQRTGRRYAEIVLFVLIGAAGLVVNDVTLWAGQEWIGLTLFWAKMLAIVVGFLWNFILRRILFDRLGERLARRGRAVDAGLRR